METTVVVASKTCYKVNDNIYVKIDDFFAGDDQIQVPEGTVGIKGLVLTLNSNTLQYNIFILPRSAFNTIIKEKEFTDLIYKHLNINVK